jgi:acyl dehydratase
MEVNSKIVGKQIKEYSVLITQRQINNYAAAVSDPNPYYLDDERPGGLIAPPTLAAAVTWPIIHNIYDYLEIDYPPEVLFRIVHSSEHLIIHRPMQSDEKIFINGIVAAVIPGDRGTQIIFKLSARDSQGSPVFTEYLGGMLRGIKCSDLGRGEENIPFLPDAPPVSQPLWEVSLPIKREACYIYEGCANVPFPIHTSPSFAHSVGLPDIIYYGIATLAQAIRELVNRENNTDPTGITEISCRFRGMVLPDSFIRIQLLYRSAENSPGKTLFFRVLNQEGREAISSGYIQISS